MGRQPQIRGKLFSWERIAILKATSNEWNWLPCDQSLPRALLRALLFRWHRRDRKEARWLEILIRELHIGTYYSRIESPVDFPRDAKVILNRISRGGYPTEPHLLRTLRAQRNELLVFMEDHHFKEHDFLPHKYWLYDNAEELYSELAHFPCMCDYVTSFRQAAWPCDDEEILNRRDALKFLPSLRRTKQLAQRTRNVLRRGVAEFRGERDGTGYFLSKTNAVHSLLSILHGTTPGHIKDLLKKTPYIFKRKASTR